MNPPREMIVTRILDIQDVTVRFGGVLALDRICVSIARGEIRGLIGPNGAGKSTLFNAISGMVDADGKIELDGQDIVNLPIHRRTGLGLRRTFQHVRLMERRTALENVMVGLHLEISANPLKSVLNLGVPKAPDGVARERVREVMSFLGIEGLILREAGTLTIAQQRLVELARALVSKPKVLMLDEPCAGLSVPAVETLNDVLIRLKNEWQLTVLLVEHVISLVIDVSDQITVLDNGRGIAEGTGEVVLNDPAVRHAYLGVEEHEGA